MSIKISNNLEQEGWHSLLTLQHLKMYKFPNVVDMSKFSLRLLFIKSPAEVQIQVITYELDKSVEVSVEYSKQYFSKVKTIIKNIETIYKTC